jgi:hypothetical protein
MELFKKHAEVMIIVGVILGHFYWIDSKFDKFSERITAIEKDTNVVKTVMFMKNILPAELAICHDKEDKG